jgi:endonuclease I
MGTVRQMGFFRPAWICMLSIIALTGARPSAAALAPGDLALIGYTSDDPDALAFVVLAPIAAGEVIRFTDSGWQTSGSFRANEGGVAYTVPSALSAGTVVSRGNPFNSDGWATNSAGLGGNSFALSTSGDQILVFQGDALSPTFVYAVNANATGWSDATNSNTTALPTGLVDGTTAVSVGGLDNYYYNGITQGTAAELRAAIGNPANWVGSDSAQTWPAWSFVVGGGGGPVPPVAYAGVDRTVIRSAGVAVELMVDATVNDADGLDGVTYAWTPATGTGIAGWVNRTGTVVEAATPGEAQVTLNQTGVYTFTLTATDADLLTGSDSVTITVTDSTPLGEYDPPTGYYDPARPGGVWYTGATLETALRGIIDGHTVRSYDAAKNALQLLDLDPNNSSNLILIYTGVSVPKVWDAGNTWNREHMWPDSLDPGGACDSDLHHLRPCDPSLNSSRGNKPFGLGSAYFDPNHGAPHRGDAARAMFYMETRYSELTLVNGQPSGNQMGDLAMLLAWHYEDPVTDGERRRNHLVYSSADNPSYYQGNRNPFIDYPELVWTIWGTGPNDAELYVGATAPGDGTSSAVVDLGAVIKGGTLPSAQTVTLNKIGVNPTTYNVTASGEVVSASIGPRQAFVGGTVARSISVGLSSSTATAGLKTGALTIDNTELTSGGAGRGAADGNDTITAELSVLEHANASFATPADQNALTIDFGTITSGGGMQSAPFSIYDLVTVVGFTAALDLDGVSPSGDTSVASADVTPFTALAAGDSASFHAYFDADAPAGVYTATYTLTVSDENLSGAQAGTSLMLTVTGTIAAGGSIFPFDDNGNSQVDLTDFVNFVACLTGPDPVAPLTSPCTNHDADSDGDVDTADFALFQIALGAP